MSTASREPANSISEQGDRMARVIEEAWQATAELGGVADVQTRQSAFVLVLESMLRSNGWHSNDAVATRDEQDYMDDNLFDDFVDEDVFSTPQVRSDEISYYLRLEEGDVAALYDVAPREVTTQVNPSALSDSKRAALREITLLELAGRTAVGLDTHVGHIQQIAERYQVCDGAAFLPPLLICRDVTFPDAPGRGKRLVRLTESGLGAVRALAKRLVTA